MAGRRSSSSRPSSPRPGDWERCSIPHSELVTLQTKGFLPPAYMIPVRAGLAVYNGGEQAESAPNPSKEEWVCLVPDLIRGLGFPNHPFLRGLLEFYGLHPSSPQPRDWKRRSIPHNELVKLQTKGFLPPAYMVPVQAGLATYNGGEQAESAPNPSKGERVCLVPYLIRGLGFPTHLFL